MTGAEREEFASQFYSRQTIIREIGASGQDKLRKARVAVIGVGGLGSVSSLYLTLAGVGYIRVIDQDTIEAHNLHRQILYTIDDLHYPKAEAAAKRLSKQNPLVQIEAASENVNASNVEELLSGVDAVVDGLDNMQTRHIVNRACVKLHIPYVFGAAIALEGNVSVFNPPQTGCLECLMPSASGTSGATCNTLGIIGATTGVIGSIQALETIKLLTGAGQTLQGKLMVCDFRDMDFTTIPITENPHCPVCHGKPEAPVGGERLVWLCGKDTANINPEKPLTLNLSDVCEKIKQQYPIRLKSQLALIFCCGDLEVSLFSGGRILIKGVKDEETALKTYRKIIHEIGL
jgi:molybdopterin-synthase adenylyltransferase